MNDEGEWALAASISKGKIMNKASFRNTALALAAGGLALAAPASALPAAHSSWNGAAVHGVSAASYNDDDDRGRHRGWGKQDRRDRRDRYRQSYQPRGYDSGYRANYGEPVYNNTRVWRGEDNRYYCRKSDGTTGLLIGGAAGALLGREVVGRNGDRTLGAILGAAGGALLGKSIDSKTRCN